MLKLKLTTAEPLLLIAFAWHYDELRTRACAHTHSYNISAEGRELTIMQVFTLLYPEARGQS